MNHEICGDAWNTWVVIGDSFSDPRHAGYAEFGVRPWPLLVAERLGVDMHVFASSGDGYAHRRAVTFPEQAMAATAEVAPESVARIILYGGINDYASGEDVEDVQTAAASCARTLTAAYPDARIEGFMNWYPHELDDSARTYIGAIAVGLGTAGVALRTDSMWILENDAVTNAYLPDNLHPNQYGHGLIASFFASS